MSTILVTGGTGALGTELVPRLEEVGHNVRVLSRRAHADRGSVRYVRGNLDTGEGLAEATSGVDVIAHLATGSDGMPSYRSAKRTDVDGTSRLVETAKRGGSPHLAYISIVGIDKIPFGYYRAKHETERVIEASGLPFTILRTTQWHTLAAEFGRLLTKSPVVLAPKGLRMQLLDAGEVAERMANLVASAPAGRAPDMGGPEVLTLSEILKKYANAMGKRRLVASLPLPGRSVAAFAAGHNLAPEHADGRITWDEYLAKHAASAR